MGKEVLTGTMVKKCFCLKKLLSSKPRGILGTTYVSPPNLETYSCSIDIDDCPKLKKYSDEKRNKRPVFGD